MRRKYRPYVAIGVGLYLLVMWSAFRWERGQHLPDGNIFEHIENERKRKFVEDQKKQAESHPASTPESRMNAAPAFIAVRYDADHVVFMVATDSESRFGRATGALQKIAAPAQPSAHLAGLEELWETDSGWSRRVPENVKDTVPGELWNLSVAPDSQVPVTIERAVTAPTGCSLALGFLAAVSEKQRAEFAATPSEYFVVRRGAAPVAEPAVVPVQSGQVSAPVSAHIAELAEWKASANLQKQIAALLNQRMLQELVRIDATLRANANSPDPNPDPWLAGNVRTRRREWLHRDKKLAAGEGQLDYDVRAFRLTPDGAPRLFVRARWKVDDTAAFLMTAWFRAEAANSQKVSAESHADGHVDLLSADSSWSSALREGRPGDALGDTLDFETILNEFDDDHDAWAELLVHSSDGTSARFTLELYTDLGLVPTRTAFQRDLVAPESCVEQR